MGSQKFSPVQQSYCSFCVYSLLGPNTYNENETIAKYEIMDGAPVRGLFSTTLYLV